MFDLWESRVFRDVLSYFWGRALLTGPLDRLHFMKTFGQN